MTTDTHDDLSDPTEREILIEIFRQVRWIARAVTALVVVTILGVGITALVRANDNADRNARDLVECVRQGDCE